MQSKSQPPLNKIAAGSKGDSEAKPKSGHGTSGGGESLSGSGGGDRDRKSSTTGGSPKTTVITIKVGVAWGGGEGGCDAVCVQGGRRGRVAVCVQGGRRGGWV